MWKLITALIILYIFSLLANVLVGIVSPMPMGSFAFILLFMIPWAYLFSAIPSRAKETLDSLGNWMPLAGVLLGMLLVAACGSATQTTYMILKGTPRAIDVLIIAIPLILFITHLWAYNAHITPQFVLSISAYAILFLAILNLNYFIGVLGIERRHDSQVLAWDLSIYSFIFGRPTEAAGLFPLIKSHLLFKYVEGAYFSQTAVFFAAILVRIKQKAELTPFFLTVTIAQLICCGVFLCYPVIGPYIYSETYALDFHDTFTYHVTQSLKLEYEETVLLQPKGGNGYVIGFPSMHVTLAILTQRYLTISRIHFWVLLPMNVLVIIATFYLGMHYLFDVAGGVILSFAIIGICESWQGSKRKEKGVGSLLFTIPTL